MTNRKQGKRRKYFNYHYELTIKFHLIIIPPIPPYIMPPNEIALLLCRLWRKVSLPVRFVPSILKFTAKFMNGLIFSLITLEEQPLKNKQSISPVLLYIIMCYFHNINGLYMFQKLINNS